MADLQSEGRVSALDGVRGLAILLVLIHHAWLDIRRNVPHSDLFLPGPFAAVAEHANVGVNLFFVLSGFLITGILLQTKHSERYFSNFYSRRALRIFPLYYSTLSVVFLLSATLDAKFPGYLGEASDRWCLWIYATNIVQSIKNNALYGNLVHFWSLAVEEQFYLVWPFIVLYCKERAVAKICVFLILSGLAVRLVCYYQHWLVACSFFTLCCIDTLAIGAVLAAHIRTPYPSVSLKKHGITVVTAVLISALAILAIPGIDPVKAGYHIIAPPLFAAVFAGLIFMAASDSHNLIKTLFEIRLLRFFGAYSYGLYVVHHLLRPPLVPINTIVSAAATPLLGSVFYVAIVWSISIAIAVLSFHTLENYFLKLKVLFPR